jgi:hypothetical protein
VPFYVFGRVAAPTQELLRRCIPFAFAALAKDFSVTIAAYRGIWIIAERNACINRNNAVRQEATRAEVAFELDPVVHARICIGRLNAPAVTTSVAG